MKYLYKLTLAMLLLAAGAAESLIAYTPEEVEQGYSLGSYVGGGQINIPLRDKRTNVAAKPQYYHQPERPELWPTASMQAAGTAPIASIAPVTGQWFVYDVTKASGPGTYLTIPDGAATVIDSNNGFIFVSAKTKCILVQIVQGTDLVTFRAEATEIDPGVTPVPVIPPTPTPNPPVPVPPVVPPTPSPPVPTPTPPVPSPAPHAETVWVIVVYDSANIPAGVKDQSFWESLRMTGTGTNLYPSTDPRVTPYAQQLKDVGSLPCYILLDGTSYAPLAAKAYTTNQDVQAEINTITGKPSKKGRYQ